EEGRIACEEQRVEFLFPLNGGGAELDLRSFYQMSDLEEKATRMRALWKSGRDKYVSFYSTLNEVRAEIVDKELPNWCFDNLRIGFSVIHGMHKVLKDTDAAIVKASMAASKIADDLSKREERETKAQKMLEKRRAKEEDSRRRELERQEREMRQAEHKK